MSAARETPGLDENLAELQANSLKVVALFAGAFGYLWLNTILPPRFGGAAPASAWVGTALLMIGAILSFVLRNCRPRIATHLLVLSILGAAICAALTYESTAIVYLFILPVIFAGLLVSQPVSLLVAAVAILVSWIVGLTRAGTLPLISNRPLPIAIVAVVVDSILSGSAIPQMVIALVSLASWLSTRNLYTALAWAWNSYERSRENEQIARGRQAQLRRALKALDEATHRFERANYMLTLARDQAEEARRLKQQFAQTISHELRTPLNLIVGFTELMAQSPETYGSQLPPAYLRDLGIVYRNACHLQNLVNDVLDLARIEAAQMSLVPEEIDPAILIREAVETARSLVEIRGLTLCTEIEPGLPRLWMDPTRIRQVLFNLLNNAVGFTDEGGVTVSVSHQEGSVVFAVTDTGVGISPEDIGRIFEEFRQGDGSTRRRQGGAGLGLAISKRFVELHKGRMRVESQVGEGSTFYFSLPTERADLANIPDDRLTAAQAARPMSAKGSEEPVLLAITRSLSAAALLKRYVHGCRTMVVPDLEQARETARLVMPQAVVIDRACYDDLVPPALEEMGRAWKLPRLPFMVCPLPGEEPARQCLAVDGYLVKPVTRQNLLDVLRRFGENIDMVLIVDDDQDAVLLLSRMLEDNPVRRYQVMGAGSGREGLTILRHYRPDLVLIDLMMSDIDGFEMIKRIRSNPEWQHIPIVVVSAYEEVENRAVLRGGVTVAKADGLVPSEIAQWVQNLVDAAANPAPAPPTPSAASAP